MEVDHHDHHDTGKSRYHDYDDQDLRVRVMPANPKKDSRVEMWIRLDSEEVPDSEINAASSYTANHFEYTYCLLFPDVE